MSREVALGWASWTSFASSFVQVVPRQQRCNGHCLSDCPAQHPAQQLKEQLHSAQVAGQWRGDTALTLPLFWRLSTVSPVFFGRFPRSSLSLSRPLRHSVPVPNTVIGHLASVDVKQHESKTGPVRKSVSEKKRDRTHWFASRILCWLGSFFVDYFSHSAGQVVKENGKGYAAVR